MTDVRPVCKASLFFDGPDGEAIEVEGNVRNISLKPSNEPVDVTTIRSMDYDSGVVQMYKILSIEMDSIGE